VGKAKNGALNQNFLLVLAKLFSNYTDFWDGTERNDFYMPKSLLVKLKKYNMMDEVRKLSSSGAVIREFMYEQLRKRLSLPPILEPKTKAKANGGASATAERGADEAHPT
jgi:hypothetical protein